MSRPGSCGADATLMMTMSHDQAPTISVVIAAYNAERWIGEALDSILVQTRPAYEIIVVDDGSSDKTPSILDTYADRITIISQRNCGAPAAFNRGFDSASGEFVALCGSDDIWEPRKLEWQAEAITAFPDVGVLCGHAVMFGDRDGEYVQPPSSLIGLSNADDVRDVLFVDNFICAPSAVIRRSLIERLGGFREDCEAEDYEYWFRCLRADAKLFYDPRTLVRWRHHSGNRSQRLRLMAQHTYRVRRDYAIDVRDQHVVRETLAPSLFNIARMLVDEGRIDEARDTFQETLRYAGRAPVSTMLRTLAWLGVLALPDAARVRTGSSLVRLSRAIDDRRASSSDAV